MMARERRAPLLRGVVLLGVCVAAAAQPPPFADTPASGESIEPPAVAPGADAARLRQLEERTAALVAEVSRLRELELLEPVEVAVASVDDIRRMLDEQIALELPEGRARGLEFTLERLGFLPAGTDLRQSILDLTLSQVAAVYDPASRTYLWVEGIDETLLESVTVHELTHALTDQHFDLQELLIRPAREATASEDELQALRFIAEGDATLVMTLRDVERLASAATAGDAPAAPLWPAVIATFRALAAMPLAEQERLLLDNPALPGMTAEVRAALAEAPAILVRPLLAAYIEGALLVAEVHQRGGWAAVDSLYERPPRSTEQVLHPDRLMPIPDEPRHPELGAVRGREFVIDEVLGELYVRTLFEAVGRGDAAAIATGWDGDRLVLIDTDEGEPMIVWSTLWDDVDEAQEFAGAYGRIFETRGSVPVRADRMKDRHGWHAFENEGRATCIAQRADAVVICQSADLARTLRLTDEVLSTATRDPSPSQGDEPDADDRP